MCIMSPEPEVHEEDHPTAGREETSQPLFMDTPGLDGEGIAHTRLVASATSGESPS